MPFDGKNKYFSGGRTEEGERVRRACRKVTEQAVYAYVEALKAVDRNGDPDHDVRLKAATALLDRGYGKPAQTIESPDGGPVQLAAMFIQANQLADVFREEFGDTGAIDTEEAKLLTDATGDGHTGHSSG